MVKKSFGALIIHGFTATPAHVAGIAPPLESAGLPCHLPTLRGHGMDGPQALLGIHWREWVKDGEIALNKLLEEVQKAIIIGHSMGGWIALNLAADHRELIDSVVIAGASTRSVSPLGPGGPLNFLTPVMARVLKKWDWTPVYADPALAVSDATYDWVPPKCFPNLFDFMRATEARLAEIDIPILILHSRADSSNSPAGAQMLYQTIATPEGQKEMVWFEKTEHEMFLDCERQAAIAAVVEYVGRRVGFAV